MCPLRPTAIVTPGATASSIAVLTILSSLPPIAVSSPELLRPSSGGTYLIGGGAAAATRAWGGGAHATSAATEKTAKEVKDFIDFASGFGTDGCQRRMERWAATILAVAR